VARPLSDLAWTTSSQRWRAPEQSSLVVVGHPGPPFDGPGTAQMVDRLTDRKACHASGRTP
jgi:hypothetical protein